jgi:galactofuranose transport system permease protein
VSAGNVPAAAQTTWQRKVQDLAPTYGAVVALILLIVANMLFTPNFAAASNMWTILQQISTTVLIAMGMTLVISTGGIDLSVGSVMAISSVVSAMSIDKGAAVAVLAGLAAAAAVGLLNGLLVTKANIQPFIVTLAVLIGGRGIAQVVSHEGELIPFENPAFQSLGSMPFQIVAMIVVTAATYFVMRATTFGRYVSAVGGNERAARLAGIAVHRTKLIVFVTSALLAGAAGIVETARNASTDSANIGSGAELDAIAAVVVGGTPFSGGRSTVLGTVVGALIMAVISATIVMHLVPAPWSKVVKAAIIVFAVYLQRPRSV